MSINAKSDVYSLRDCMLLPITDTAGNSLGFKVYEELERYLKKEKWCDYKSSGDVIEIFGKYREKLPEYLQDENVIKSVADRLKVGTIIRVTLEYEIDSLKINVDVIGENGIDKYLSEKAIINKIDSDQAVTTITNWLETFRAIIPYDGKVLGVLGDQITFDFSKDKQIGIGQEFRIRRLVRKKNHPLLKKVVEWESELIAKGKVYNLSRGQGLGLIKIYTADKKLQAGDWVKLEKFNPKKDIDAKTFQEMNENSFGKLGEVFLGFSLASHTTSTNAQSGSNKMNGFIYGISAEFEAWLTREYFALGEFSRRIGTLSKTSGNPSSNESGQNSGVFKIGAGYKYLPMGFFYGPQINAYAGWVKYSYELDGSDEDAFGTNAFSGFFVGMGGSIPLEKRVRVYGSGEVIPFPTFDDEDNIFGGAKSISSMAFEIGAQYDWSYNLRLYGAFESISNTAKFKGSNSELTYRDSNFKMGAIFTF